MGSPELQDTASEQEEISDRIEALRRIRISIE